jgi:hypothetical protein
MKSAVPSRLRLIVVVRSPNGGKEVGERDIEREAVEAGSQSSCIGGVEGRVNSREAKKRRCDERDETMMMSELVQFWLVAGYGVPLRSERGSDACAYVVPFRPFDSYTAFPRLHLQRGCSCLSIMPCDCCLAFDLASQCYYWCGEGSWRRGTNF